MWLFPQIRPLHLRRTRSLPCLIKLASLQSSVATRPCNRGATAVL